MIKTELWSLCLVAYLVCWHTSAGTIFSALGGLELVPGYNVNEEVKLVVLGDGHGNVVPLCRHKEKVLTSNENNV